jgi:hypothetical protein
MEPNKDWSFQMTPETLEFLKIFMHYKENIFLDLDDADIDPIAELEYLDSTVQGDYHPEMLNLIMTTYKKIESEQR